MPCHGTPSLALIPLELFVWIKAFVWYVLRSDINGIRSCSKEFGGGGLEMGGEEIYETAAPD